MINTILFSMMMPLVLQAADFDRDLVFAKQTLLENHPGVYNPLDPDFTERLEENFKSAEQKLQLVSTEEEGRGVLRDFGRSFKDSHLRIWYEPSAKAEERQFGVEELSDDVHWIYIPTFYPASEEQKQALQNILQTLPKLREKTIVFDLRGNRGGARSWGTELVKALFGKEYAEMRLSELYRYTSSVWRLSPGNLEHMRESMMPALKSHFGEHHAIFQWIANLYPKVEEAYSRGEFSYFEPANPQVISPVNNPVTGRIFAIVDKNCFSATLMFIDELKAMQADVTLVGETTGADSMYMEFRIVSLPSGSGQLGFPISIHHGPCRGHNVPYHPDIPCDLQETTELQNFVLERNRSL